MTAEEEGRDGRGKEENPLKRAFPPSPAPPSFFPKRFIFWEGLKEKKIINNISQSTIKTKPVRFPVYTTPENDLIEEQSNICKLYNFCIKNIISVLHLFQFSLLSPLS